MTDTITLWGVSISPYARKIRIALTHKGLPYNHEPVLPTLLMKATNQDIPPVFAAISPLGRIPALQHGDVAIADSSIIAQYLDAAFSDKPAIYPKDPAAFARALWFERYGDETLTAVTYRGIFFAKTVTAAVLKAEPDEAAVNKAINEDLPPLLDYLETSLGDGPWFAGSEFSMADASIATQFVAIGMAGVTIDRSKYPKLADFFERFKAHPSVQPVLASE